MPPPEPPPPSRELMPLNIGLDGDDDGGDNAGDGHGDHDDH